jgi:hypothetical protein
MLERVVLLLGSGVDFILDSVGNLIAWIPGPEASFRENDCAEDEQ